VLRETVFANTETLLGITVAQNVKNQMYEVKVGYVRHELFLVPTSKFVKYTKQGDTLLEAPEGDSTNDPSKTPEVLGEIMVDGRIPVQGGQTVGFGLRQKLAVGPLAVQSPGAIALMADTDAEAQTTAGVRIKDLTQPTLEQEKLRARLKELLEANAELKKEVVVEVGDRQIKCATGQELADALVRKHYPGSTLSDVEHGDAKRLQEFLRFFETELNKAQQL